MCFSQVDMNSTSYIILLYSGKMSAQNSFRKIQTDSGGGESARHLLAGGSASSRFRLNNTAKEQLSLRREIDGMAHRSIRDILVERKKRQNVDIEDKRNEILRFD